MEDILKDFAVDYLDSGWLEFFEHEKNKTYFRNLITFLDEEYKNRKILPKKEQVFRTFLIPPKKVRAVILGQDPYHTDGVANGLAFSVNHGQKIPPSLKNIFKEIEDDIYDKEVGYVKNGDLSRWAEQGVMLLNNVLTVREGRPNSHKNHGWEIFTKETIKYLNDNFENIVFLLWGNEAKTKKELINPKKHLILETTHPSPLSARKGFFGCKHFSQVNDFLRKNRLEEIIW